MCEILDSMDGIRKELSTGNWTVFAIEDESIDSFRTEMNISSSNSDMLKNLVEYHLYPGGRLMQKDLRCYYPENLLTMRNGRDSRTRCLEDEPFGQKGELNEYPLQFVEFDIEAENGIIHAIDDILLYRDYEENIEYSYSEMITERVIDDFEDD